jgi:hypothetical protein
VPRLFFLRFRCTISFVSTVKRGQRYEKASQLFQRLDISVAHPKEVDVFDGSKAPIFAVEK